MPGQDLAVMAVETPEALDALRAEWMTLHARAPDRMAAQHPAYFDAAREAAPPGRQLLAIAVRQAGALAGVWPLSLSTVRGCRVATHAGCGSNEEYSGMLIAPEADAAAVAAAAVHEIRRRADFITVYNLPPASPLIEAVRRGGLASSTNATTSYVVDLAAAGDWDGWLRTKSKNFRQNLGGQRRNLAKLGMLQSVQDEPAIIPWFFREKRRWLERTGSRSAWVSTPELGERFFEALADRGPVPLKTFALALDGAYVAAGLCVVSHDRLEYIATVYAAENGRDRYSPGALVSEDCGRWAVEHGLDLDFRVMDVPYKHRWISRTDRFVTVRAAFSARGALEYFADAARRSGHRVRVRAAVTVKGYAAKLRTRLGARKG
jgi:CelD/BcsL family acetyltransferase involved in cellulose biosynthesis